MKPIFNLLIEPWIPCIEADGTPIELSLREVLARADELRELTGESPLVTASLYRVLLALLHRVFGPATLDEWANLWTAGRWDMGHLDTYLGQWEHRFDLFDPRYPFYQTVNMTAKPKPVTSLVHHIASGNNATLFDHHTDEGGIDLRPAVAARMVTVAHTFGLAGLSGLPEKFTDGPWARGAIFLAQGDTLFETFVLNLLRYPDEEQIYSLYSHPDDCPAWEMDDPFQPQREYPRGYLDYLTWQNRRIQFFPTAIDHQAVVREMKVVPGLRLAGEILHQDPMKRYRIDPKSGYRVLRFDEERALWRDSAVLFRLHDSGNQTPAVFRWLARLVDEGYLVQSQSYRYLALGMANDRAKVEFYRSERMPLPLAYLCDQVLVDDLSSIVTMADRVSDQLWGAGATLAKVWLAPGDDQSPPKEVRNVTEQMGITRRFWSRLEVPFRETIEVLPRDHESTMLAWRQTLIATAWNAINQAADGLGASTRALKATVRAREQLALGLAKVFPAQS
ncbi:MAG: type I-E CRISPR-associated protein Cse1/CasA [Ardenticatenaceae bacterium]|nr:type I-E CRISPR-associated protein Cse1/CasA [Ardenticatenaceae bacterium]